MGRLVWCPDTSFAIFLSMYYLYVLRSLKDGKAYIGSTTDLKRRLNEHKIGKVDSTRPRLPMELIYYEAYSDEKDARERESKLKLKSRAYEQLRKRIRRSLQLSTRKTPA